MCGFTSYRSARAAGNVVEVAGGDGCVTVAVVVKWVARRHGRSLALGIGLCLGPSFGLRLRLILSVRPTLSVGLGFALFRFEDCLEMQDHVCWPSLNRI